MEDGYNFTLHENKTDIYDTFLSESRFWIQKVLLPLAVAVGVLGNGVTIIVLTRKRMRSSTNTYLTALAISNLLYLIFTFTLSLEHYDNSHSISNYYYWQYYRFGFWFSDAATCTSTWLTVTFTVERYIAVCHPMRGRVLCTESRARVIIALVYVIIILATMTTPMEWECTVTTTERDNITTQYVGVTPTALGRDPTYKTIFYGFWSFTFVFLPLLLLGVFNSFLIYAVHSSKKQRCRMTQTDFANSRQKRENRITITLIAVVIFFMVCQIPTASLLIYSSFRQHEPNSKGDKLSRIFGNVFNFLTTVNAAANFILYFSARYRRTLLALLRCRTLPSPTQSTVYTPEFSRLMRGSTMRTIRDNSSIYRPNGSTYRASIRNGNMKEATSLTHTDEKL